MNQSSQIPFCLNRTLPRIVPPGTLLYYIGHILPILFLIGIIGNVLNLIVLGMKNRTNIFLFCMAFADMCFLILMTWFNLITFDGPALNGKFLAVYYNSKTTTTMLLNWFSGCSTWFAVAVTAERFIAVRFPLKASYILNKSVMIFSIIFILLITVMSSLHNFAYTYRTIPTCTDPTQLYYYPYLPLRTRNGPIYDYVRVSTALSALICAVVPILLLTIINCLLIISLRQNRRSLANLGQISKTSHEFRVTVTVVIITVTALVLLSPSVALTLWDAIQFGPQRKIPPWYGYFAYFCNLLVIIDRTSNFLLYCLTSQAFRSKLKLVLYQSGILKGPGGHRGSTGSMLTRATSYSAIRRSTIGRQSDGELGGVKGELMELLVKGK